MNTSLSLLFTSSNMPTSITHSTAQQARHSSSAETVSCSERRGRAGPVRFEKNDGGACSLVADPPCSSRCGSRCSFPLEWEERSPIECWRCFRKTMRYAPRALLLCLFPSLSLSLSLSCRFMRGTVSFLLFATAVPLALSYAIKYSSVFMAVFFTPVSCIREPDCCVSAMYGC